MNGPRITDEDRGITLNKPLAWTVVVSLIGAGLWLGSEVVGTKNMVLDIRAAQLREEDEQAQYQRDVDLRLRTLENARAEAGSEMAALRNDLTEFRQDVRDLSNLLRTLERKLGGQQQ